MITNRITRWISSILQPLIGTVTYIIPTVRCGTIRSMLRVWIEDYILDKSTPLRRCQLALLHAADCPWRRWASSDVVHWALCPSVFDAVPPVHGTRPPVEPVPAQPPAAVRQAAWHVLAAVRHAIAQSPGSDGLEVTWTDTALSRPSPTVSWYTHITRSPQTHSSLIATFQVTDNWCKNWYAWMSLVDYLS